MPANIISHDDIGLAEYGIGKCDIEPERLAVGLARQSAGHPVALTFVNHSLVHDRGVLGIGRDGEHHELPEIVSCRVVSCRAAR